MIKIDSFSVKRDNGKSSSSNGGGGFANIQTTVDKELEMHKIWGQDFNGTQDVDGDFSTNGNVTAVSANIGNINADNVSTNSLSSSTANLQTIKGSKADLQNVISENITTDYLTVTKSAHFWELIIDKISATKGAIIVSPTSAKIEQVLIKDGCYILAWKAVDAETGKEISNDFKADDQIVCQTFNVAAGENFAKNNKYYWWLVVESGRKILPDPLSNDEVPYNFIKLHSTEKDGSSIPEVGDEIAVLGNRSDTSRQNAIIISSTNGEYLDTEIEAPSIVQYQGINTFSLKPYRFNTIAASGNVFVGDFKIVNTDGTLSDIQAGKDGKGVKSIITKYLTFSKNEGLSNVVIWNNGSTTMPVNFDEKTPYLWQCSRTYFTDDSNVLSPAVCIGHFAKNGDKGNKGDKGDQGINGILYKLVPTTALATVGIDDILRVNISGYVNYVNGDVIIPIENLSNMKINIVDNLSSTTNIFPYSNTFAFSNNNYKTDYSKQEKLITHFHLLLFEKSTNKKLDELTFNVNFETGAVFEVGKNAITSSVQLSKNYTDGQISTVKQTADGISSRVTNIEKDYVTESEIKQTAENISLSVFDRLKNKTGIDVSTGKITLNAENTTVVGNLNLTDTQNGLTIYDSAKSPRINLQPKDIADIATFDKDTYVYKQAQPPTGTTGGKEFETEKTIYFSLSKYDVLSIDNIAFTLFGKDGQSTIFPKADTINGKIKITDKLGKTVKNENISFSRSDIYGNYQYIGSPIIFKTVEDGLFYVTYYITPPPNITAIHTLSCIVNARYQSSQNVQTYIGQDGFFSHPSANKMLYTSANEMRFQHGFNGIRWTDDDKFGNYSMEVAAGKRGESPLYKPLWLPFYNYVPVYQPSAQEYIYQPVQNLGSSRYAFQLSAIKHRGIIMASEAAQDAKGVKQESWIILPSATFRDRRFGSDLYNLPVGYMVKIINNLKNANAVACYVTPSTTEKDKGKIYYSERGNASYIKLTGDNSMKTFMYIGTYGGVCEWRVID